MGESMLHCKGETTTPLAGTNGVASLNVVVVVHYSRHLSNHRPNCHEVIARPQVTAAEPLTECPLD